MNMPEIAADNRAARRARQSNRKSKAARLGYRVSEWSEMTGTSRQTTWRAIRNGTLKRITYAGITLIPDSERVRLFQPNSKVKSPAKALSQ
jgi:hypothetical protein